MKLFQKLQIFEWLLKYKKPATKNLYKNILKCDICHRSGCYITLLLSPVAITVTTNLLAGTMGMNKNSIFAWASFCTLLIGIALVLLGVLKYQDYAIGFSTVGIGFFVMSWAFNALKGRV